MSVFATNESTIAATKCTIAGTDQRSRENGNANRHRDGGQRHRNPDQRLDERDGQRRAFAAAHGDVERALPAEHEAGENPCGNNAEDDARFTRSEAEGVSVLENQRSRERERRLRPDRVRSPIRVEPFVIHEPEVCSLGESVAQADVEVEPVGGRIVLDERVARRPRVERGANADARDVDVRRLGRASRSAAS